MLRAQVLRLAAADYRRAIRLGHHPTRRERRRSLRAQVLQAAARCRGVNHSEHHRTRKEILLVQRAQVLRAAAACQKASHWDSRRLRKARLGAAAPTALRLAGSSGRGCPEAMQAGRRKTGMPMVRRQERVRLLVLRGLARSSPAAWPQAVPPCVDPEGRWAPGIAPGRRDTIQRPAVPPVRCAGRFPAGQGAGKAAAPQAAPPCAPLRLGADGSHRRRSAVHSWGWPP